MLLQFFIIFVTTAGYYCAIENPVVETPLGTILGSVRTSYNGRSYLVFEGIPYAKPPIGERRFEEPEPVDPWEGTWNATTDNQCAQISPGLAMSFGEEDCLYINVYVPREEINLEEKLEVVVHIHGGGFYSGSGTGMDPTYVADKDIIFVTFNYRLTVFGFLSTEDEVVPGNNGLKDQVLALKWVQVNIGSFGGNPDSVTINGMSAGAASVHLHYFSDLSKGLFHRGFAQSGVALNAWATNEGNLDKAKQFADAVGCPTDTTRNLVDCLKEVPQETIALSLQIFHEDSWIFSTPFAPVVEQGGTNPFLAEHPYILLANGQVQDLPLIVSNTIHEGSVVTENMSQENYPYVDSNWDELAPRLFYYNYTLPSESWQSVAEQIREHYFADEKITANSNLTLIQSLTDRLFSCDSETAVRLQSQVTTSPVYYYLFAYPLGGNPVPVWHDTEYFIMYPYHFATDSDLIMKDLLWDMVVSFAKTGTPSFGDIDWQPTTYEEHRYLYVSGGDVEDIESRTTEELTDRNFWKSLHFAENENLVDTY